MLQLVLGASGSGKSYAIMETIKQRAKAGKRSLLVVPEQVTSSTESRIYNRLGDELSGFVTSYSFSSLAEAILTQYGGVAVSTLTDAGRTVLFRRALKQVKDSLTYYNRHANNAAFCEKCAETLDEFKNAGVSPQQLEQLANTVGIDAAKLTDLSLIYAAYEAMLEGSAMDTADRQLTAAAQVEADFFADTAVFVDEFDTFNVPKKQLLAQMLAYAESVTVALCADGLHDTDEGIGLFSGAKKVAAMLVQLAHKQSVPVAAPKVLTTDWRHKSSPMLAKMTAILEGQTVVPEATAGETITLYQAPNRPMEAKQLAVAVSQLARKGVAYGDMAIICRESGNYMAAVRYEFRLADIPIFFDEATTAEQAAPIRLVKALFGLLCRGLSADGLLAVAKTGLTSLPEDQMCALENYAYTWRLSAADLRKPFVNSPAGFSAGEMRPEEEAQLALAEAAREWLVSKLTDFIEKAKGRSAEEICALIYKTMQILGSEDCIQAACAALKQTEGIPAAEEAMRVWNLAGELLNQMALLLGDERLPATELLETFELLVRSTDLGRIPQTLDCVIFTTAARMRLTNARHCFVLGLAEGEFPQTPSESGLLTHAEREALIEHEIDMANCFETSMVHEQMSFYKALSIASEGVWLSWATDGGTLPLTEALQAVVETLNPPAPPALTQEDFAISPAAALDALGEGWDPESRATATLYAAVDALPQGETLLTALNRTAVKTAFHVQDTAALERLLGGKNLRLSPSRMEKYYACPFSYFMEYVLGARTRRQAALTPDQSGNVVHYVLENALKNPARVLNDAQNAQGFVALSQEQLKTLAEALVDEYVAQNMPDTTRRFGYLISRLKTSVAGLLVHLQNEQKQSAFAPDSFEAEIGDNAAIKPVRLPLQDGKTVRMTGKIDRVDLLQKGTTTWVRVVDYKTGSKEFSLDDVKNGVNCQMLIYLFALLQNLQNEGKTAKPAGVLYQMADPSPNAKDRNDAKDTLSYAVEGLVVDDDEIIEAMDREATGVYVPIGFKDGAPKKNDKSSLSLSQLEQLQPTIDELIVQMAQRLYDGEVDAEPLTNEKSKHSPCDWCDYNNVCGRQTD